MSRLNEWRAALARLRSIADRKAFLLEHSGLPGPRGNLELLEAAYLDGDERLFASCRNYAPDLAPTNSAEVSWVMVGVAGLAKSYLAGTQSAMRSLREYASDPRWRVREAVAIGLQHIGDRGVPVLLAELESWRTGNLLEQRAVVAALCEPRLLRERATAERVIEILADITGALAERGDRTTDEFAVLRKSLGYGWSVAIVAAPVKGKAAFRRLLKSTDKDVRWIAKENLSKNRLVRMDADWVDSAKAKLAKA
jgi:HEAT repeat protein